jgi:hypothetical protein
MIHYIQSFSFISADTFASRGRCLSLIGIAMFYFAILVRAAARHQDKMPKLRAAPAVVLAGARQTAQTFIKFTLILSK